MSYQSIELSIDQRVAHIVLNKPSTMNAFDRPLRDDLRDAVQACAANDDVLTIVISAAGRGFSSGTDLNEATTMSVYPLLDNEYKSLVNAIVDCPKPVIAAVNGACAGVGASIALACDLVMMSESAFIFLAFANVGLIPDGGMCWHLVRNIGYKRAYQIAIEGGRMTAAQCAEHGLANKVVADDKLVEEALAWARKLTAAAPRTLSLAKHAMQSAQRLDLDDTVRLEAGLQALCSTSEDGKEGIRAFLEKRKPVFTGN